MGFIDGLDGAGANEDLPGDAQAGRVDLRSVPRGRAEEGAGGKEVLVQATEKVSPSPEERWLSMTKTEKRRLWLHRRRSGEFYFRSEFKGLVHAVRKTSLNTVEQSLFVGFFIIRKLRGPRCLV